MLSTDNRLKLVSPEIDQYCTHHSSSPSKTCAELEKYTRENIPASIMLVGPLVGSFLGFMVRLFRAKRILEIGCYTGYSALCMAERMDAGGELITLDMNPETMEVAKSYWAKSPAGSRIKPILGDAKKTLRDLKPPFDLIFMDATKSEYKTYLQLTEPLLSDSGFWIVDNCLQSGRVVLPNPEEENVRSIQAFNDFISSQPHLESVLLPVRDGLYLIRKKNKHE